MNDSDSSWIIAWLAAISASPIRATTDENSANDSMSSSHWPPIGALVRRKRRIWRRSGRLGVVAKRARVPRASRKPNRISA